MAGWFRFLLSVTRSRFLPPSIPTVIASPAPRMLAVHNRFVLVAQRNIVQRYRMPLLVVVSVVVVYDW